jgi:creatinine amidohydrolase
LPFSGTLTASLPVYENMLMEIVLPLLREGFGRVMLLNGHGGNIDPLRVALRRLDVMFPKALLTGGAYWEMAEAEIAALCEGPRKSVGHACEVETSMMLAIRPDLVRMDRVRDDPSEGGELGALFWARDFARRTDHGAVGYPERATAEKGRRMLEAIVGRVVATTEGLLGLPLG